MLADEERNSIENVIGAVAHAALALCIVHTGAGRRSFLELRMAGDWIKMRVNLATDPSVIGISAAVDLDTDTVVGKLHRIWSWANEQSRDGNAASVTLSWIDRYIGVTGFAQAMVDVGWLLVNADGISIPNWDRHNSKSAKQRSLGAIRQSRKRNAASVTKALPEKRREEKRIAPLSTKAPSPPSVPQFTKSKPPPKSTVGEAVWNLACVAEELLGRPFAVKWGRDQKAILPILNQLGPDELLVRWRAFLEHSERDEFLAGNRTMTFFASRINSDWSVTNATNAEKRREQEQSQMCARHPDDLNKDERIERW